MPIHGASRRRGGSGRAKSRMLLGRNVLKRAAAAKREAVSQQKKATQSRRRFPARRGTFGYCNSTDSVGGGGIRDRLNNKLKKVWKNKTYEYMQEKLIQRIFDK